VLEWRRKNPVQNTRDHPNFTRNSCAGGKPQTSDRVCDEGTFDKENHEHSSKRGNWKTGKRGGPDRTLRGGFPTQKKRHLGFVSPVERRGVVHRLGAAERDGNEEDLKHQGSN